MSKVDMALDDLLRLVVHGIEEGRVKPAVVVLKDIIAQIPDHPMKAAFQDQAATIAALRKALDEEHSYIAMDRGACDPRTCQVCALLADGKVAREYRRACPCLHTTPCSDRCTCVSPFSSFGCQRCCTYGSAEQQRNRAERIAAAILSDAP